MQSKQQIEIGTKVLHPIDLDLDPNLYIQVEL